MAECPAGEASACTESSEPSRRKDGNGWLMAAPSMASEALREWRGSSRGWALASPDADPDDINLLHDSDPVKVELGRLENEVREKDRELSDSHAQTKALKLTERLREKAIQELSEKLLRVEEQLNVTESLLENKNLEIKKFSVDKKALMAAQFAAESTLRQVHETPPIEAILAPQEAELKLARQAMAKLQEDNKALDRLTKSKEAALVEAERTARFALAKASTIDDLQNKNQQLLKQMGICQEENKILDKINRQKVGEVEKLSQTVQELEEAVLAGGGAANAVRDYQRKVQEINEERKTVDRELARAKVTANRVAVVIANEWKDADDKVMPVRQWLDERRFLQGASQQLRVKLAIAERAAKSEAQLKEKYQLRLKVLEEALKGTSTGDNLHANRRALSNFSSSGFLRKRSSSFQLRSSSSSTCTALRRAKGSSKSLGRSKFLLNTKVTVNSLDCEEAKDGETADALMPTEKPIEFQTADIEDSVSGVLYDLLQKEVVALRKSGREKDQWLKDKDDTVEMLAKKIDTLMKALDVEGKKMRREVAAMEKELAAMRMEKKHENRGKVFRSSKGLANCSQFPERCDP